MAAWAHLRPLEAAPLGRSHAAQGLPAGADHARSMLHLHRDRGLPSIVPVLRQASALAPRLGHRAGIEVRGRELVRRRVPHSKLEPKVGLHLALRAAAAVWALRLASAPRPAIAVQRLELRRLVGAAGSVRAHPRRLGGLRHLAWVRSHERRAERALDLRAGAGCSEREAADPLAGVPPRPVSALRAPSARPPAIAVQQ